MDMQLKCLINWNSLFWVQTFKMELGSERGQNPTEPPHKYNEHIIVFSETVYK